MVIGFPTNTKLASIHPVVQVVLFLASLQALTTSTVHFSPSQTEVDLRQVDLSQEHISKCMPVDVLA